MGRRKTPLTLLGLLAAMPLTFARVPCKSSSDCPEMAGSECLQDGYCSNPYHDGGCFFNRAPGWKKKRICNSEDTEETIEKGYCRLPQVGMEHEEIRIFAQNWESGMFEAFILQVILSELLDVPSTIETGSPDAYLNFYDPSNRFDYGTSNDWDALERGNGDCLAIKASNIDNPDSYLSCAHVIPEIWNPHLATLEELENRQIIEPHLFLGVIGEQSVFVPKITAQRDPALLSYLGLQGQENRRKLAQRFKRPTTWKQYCDEVSSNNCSSPDDIASRAPQNESENGRMYVERIYQGYFRHTPENNCTASDSCTGLIADYPCTWASFIQPQMYHLDIGLESSGSSPGSRGYSYSQLVEMWRAANATQTDIAIHWWRPEALYQEFLGTDFEFQKVLLPPPTQECIENRIKPGDRCSDDFDKRVGNPLGACDQAYHPLMKAIVKTLFEKTAGSSIPDALKSPAYDAIKEFRINGLQLGRIFEYWAQKPDRYGFAPRDAVCQWMAENADFVESFVPRTFPRRLEGDEKWRVLGYVATSLAAFSVLASVLSLFLLWSNRTERKIKVAQIEFIMLLGTGVFLLSIGALLQALTPTDRICSTRIWFIYLGYCLELVPLIIKIAAINRLMQAAQSMKRITLSRQQLFGAVFLLSSVVLVFLTIWTLVDPSERNTQFRLTNRSSGKETIVSQNYYCTSESDAWDLIGIGAQCFLLVYASILAFQTRNLRHDINESQTLAILTYSHFVFVVLRLLSSFLMDDSLSASELARFESILYSADAFAVMLIYFVPKLHFHDDDGALTPGRSRTFSYVMQRIVQQLPSGSRQSRQQAESKSMAAISESPVAESEAREKSENTGESTNSTDSVLRCRKCSKVVSCSHCHDGPHDA